MSYETGTYVKGESRKVARRKSDAVALVFEGYTLEDAAAPAVAPTVSETAEVRDDTPTQKPARAKRVQEDK
jgi:hypothetical protein